MLTARQVGKHLQPVNVIPAIPLLSAIGMLTARCSQVPRLSPVHVAPTRCEPEKKERDSTKGRLVGEDRGINALAVALCLETRNVTKRNQEE